MFKNIFDLDNTLVFTDELNSEAYNYALRELNKHPILDIPRVTRNAVFERYTLTEHEIQQLLFLKRTYFSINIHKIRSNIVLFNHLNSLSPTDCMLWTSAEEFRVEPILSYFRLQNSFSKVFYSAKTDIRDDIDFMCNFFHCQKKQLRFYENDISILNQINAILKSP